LRRGIFVTGTDTGVGKTVASSALVHALRAAGEKVTPMKPIAAGADEREGVRVNEDSVALMEAAGLGPEALERVTPILLREPMSPHIAAAREGRRVSLEPVVRALEGIRERDFLVVEGVGGFMVPLADDLDTVDLARAVGLPVVLVVGLRLGCLNHALLTARAIEAAGLPLAGWIANAIDPAMLVPDENVETLRARLKAPLLGRLPWQERPDPRALARRLDVRPLLAPRP
jgi:dethiobiotin synthetase